MGRQLRERQLQLIRSFLANFPAPESFQGPESVYFHPTSCDRDIQGIVQHRKVVGALDTVNNYQSSRNRLKRNRARCAIMHHASENEDPRTLAMEVLKRWLRAAAARSEVSDVELDLYISFCTNILLKGEEFPPARANYSGHRSFIPTLADVLKLLQEHQTEHQERTQSRKREAIEEKRQHVIMTLRQNQSCIETLKTSQTYCCNLLMETCVFLLVGLTDLMATDDLPSLEAKTLWQSLPEQWYSLHGPGLQRHMTNAWTTCCGRTVAAVVSSRWFVQLQQSTYDRREPCTSVKTTIDGVNGVARNSGFAGILEKQKDFPEIRKTFFEVCQLVDDIAYLNSVIVHFQDVSRGLGDYGVIRLAKWLHPLLDELTGKVQQLQIGHEKLHRAFMSFIVIALASSAGRSGKFSLAWARRDSVPSPKMQKRATDASRAAFGGLDNHSQKLLSALNDLRKLSDPSRLQGLEEEVTGAVTEIFDALRSDEFRAHVGADFQFPAMPAQVAGHESRAAEMSIENGGPARLAVEDADLTAMPESGIGLAEPSTRETRASGGSAQSEFRNGRTLMNSRAALAVRHVTQRLRERPGACTPPDLS